MDRTLISRRGALGLAAGLACIPGAARASIFDDILDVVTGGKTGDSGGKSGSGGLTNDEIILGLKEALRLGTDRAIGRVGRENGYFGDSLIRIRLPGFLETAQEALSAIGQSALLDDLELRLNRGAEKAAPFAKKIFHDAVKAMTIEDAVGILRGPDNSATLYFERAMTPTLKTTFRPIIKRELDGAGALRAFDNVVDAYKDIPFVPALGADAKEDLIDHGLGGALHGLFTYIGKEEAAIRNDPAKRTSEILKKVFK